MLAVGLLLQIYDKSRMKKHPGAHTLISMAGSARCPRRFTSIRQEHAATVPLATGHPREAGDIFKKSLAYAKSVGYLKSRKLKIALDTTTYLRPGCGEGYLQPACRRDVKLMSALARRESPKSLPGAGQHDLSRYLSSSIKERSNQLGRSFGAQGLSRWHCCRCRQAPHSCPDCRKKCPRNSPDAADITQAAELLSSLLAQDIGAHRRGCSGNQRGRCQRPDCFRSLILRNARAQEQERRSMVTRRQSPSM